MLRSQVSGYLFCKNCLVVAFLLHTNGKALYLTLMKGLHQCHHCAAVDSRREKCTHRNIGNHLLCDRSLQKLFQFIRCFLFRSLKQILLTLSRCFLHTPIRRNCPFIKWIFNF